MEWISSKDNNSMFKTKIIIILNKKNLLKYKKI